MQHNIYHITQTCYGVQRQYTHKQGSSPCSPPEHAWTNNLSHQRGLKYPLPHDKQV
ncbi:hypothetical protein Hanom_Chr08g00727951 [Helianthus anomalus]